MEPLFDEDLPPDARALIENAKGQVEKLRAKAEADIQRIRAEAERDTTAAQQRADDAISGIMAELATCLKPLQDAYSREGKLDEALAIRARIRSSRTGGTQVHPAPEVLCVARGDVGKSALYEVTGSIHGPLWGTDVYTSESSLAKAVVHAGLLKKGERGIVKVNFLDTSDRVGFEGTRRNGVLSEHWDEWELGFQISQP
jgi:hypothetical protein